jgi:hypothetical protein
MRRVFACLLLGTLAAGCDGLRGGEGQVVDNAHMPVADASVRLLKIGDDPSRASESKTNRKGYYSVGLVGSPTGKNSLDLTVSKDGFKTYDEVIDLSPGLRETNIVLNGEDKE